MPFQENKIRSRVVNFIQVQKPVIKNKRNTSVNILKRGRAYFFASYSLKGGITLEAAVVTPIFLMFFCSILYLFLVIRLNLKIQDAAAQTIMRANKLEYINTAFHKLTGSEKAEAQKETGKWIERIGEFVTPLILKEEVIEIAGRNNFQTSILPDGTSGIHVYHTKIDHDKGEIELVLDYSVSIPVLPAQIFKLQVKQSSKSHLWTGKSLQNRNSENKSVVYITPNGSVYHTNKNCMHIDIKVLSGSREEIASKHNSSGRKYSKCLTCSRKAYDQSVVYYTRGGEKYHFAGNCSRINREVIEIDIKEVGSMRKCKRCAGGTG